MKFLYWIVATIIILAVWVTVILSATTLSVFVSQLGIDVIGWLIKLPFGVKIVLSGLMIAIVLATYIIFATATFAGSYNARTESMAMQAKTSLK
jgi:hypothetical protein